MTPAHVPRLLWFAAAGMLSLVTCNFPGYLASDPEVDRLSTEAAGTVAAMLTDSVGILAAPTRRPLTSNATASPLSTTTLGATATRATTARPEMVPLAEPTYTLRPPISGWEHYAPRSLASVIAEQPVHEDLPAGEIAIYFGDIPGRANVFFEGQSRPLDPAHVIVLRRGGAKITTPSGEQFDPIEFYPVEYAFREGSLVLWIPVQAGLIPDIEDELVPGQQVTIYIRYVGSYQSESGSSFVFILNEFQE